MDEHEAKSEAIARRLRQIAEGDGGTKARGRTSMGSTKSGTSSGSGPRRDAWAPRLILVRSFAPFGASAAEKVRQKEVASIQETIKGCCERAALIPCPG